MLIVNLIKILNSSEMVLVTYSFFESHYKSSHIFAAEMITRYKIAFPNTKMYF